MTETNENPNAGNVHMDAEKILSYRAGKLSAPYEESAQEHLLDCEDCIDLMLLAGDDPVDEKSGVVDFEKEWIWTRIHSAKASEAATESRGRRPGRTERYGLVAAMFALCVLGAFNIRQGGVITDLTTPQLNVAIHDFVTQAPRRSLSAADPVSKLIEISEETKYYAMVFTLDPQKGAAYRVEILNSKGREVWGQRGLEVDAFGFATLGLSRHFLDEGTYRIRIFREGSEEETIADYPVTIRFL